MKQFSLLFSFLILITSGSGLLAQCVEITSDIAELYCPGEEITLTATEGFDNYSWYFNFSDSNEDGQLLMESGSENSITISASEWAVAYIYVTVDDENCSEPSSTVVWDSWVFAGIGISHDFNTTFCPGDSSLIQNAFNGPVNFQWYKDFEPVEGAISASYWVTEPGTYTLQASYAECPDYWLNSGIGPTFQFYNVQIPVINFEYSNGFPNLFITSGIEIQWYINGEALFGANSTSFIPLSNGTYHVTAIDQNGCNVTSEPYEFNTLSSETPHAGEKFEVFPNPFQNEINMISTPTQSNGIARIFDLTGKQVSSQKIRGNAAQTSMNLNNLNKGIYLLEVIFENGDKEVMKLIKSN